jgi:hypothetical protein
MEAPASKVGWAVVLWFCVVTAAAVFAQTAFDSSEIPPKFNLDMKTAELLRPQLMAHSVAVSTRFGPGALVFSKLTEVARGLSTLDFAWQLRIVEDDELNAYASPDGTIFVDSGLSRLAGTNAGLWAAILSHEIAHVLRRDWARRYLYQKSLENDGASIALGDPGLPFASWKDGRKASQDLGQFCRRLEIDADRDGLMLMARAGYHPDFVPALHHLLHAAGSGKSSDSLYAMHPCWEERDRELRRAYLEASIEFEHRWPEWYASPGGNPPVLVFADEPIVRKTASNQWEVQLPIHCENLAGAVEVVLRTKSLEQTPSLSEVRQLSGCTSPRTTVILTVLQSANERISSSRKNEVYVLDAWGSVLSRTDLPKLR